MQQSFAFHKSCLQDLGRLFRPSSPEVAYSVFALSARYEIRDAGKIRSAIISDVLPEI